MGCNRAGLVESGLKSATLETARNFIERPGTMNDLKRLRNRVPASKTKESLYLDNFSTLKSSIFVNKTKYKRRKKFKNCFLVLISYEDYHYSHNFPFKG
jgi:hypothetical protein